MQNLLLQEVEYKIEETPLGIWRRFGYSTGASFHEFKSHVRIFGLPLVHYTSGRNPETGRRVAAKGFIAVGRIACGVIAIGQASFGIIAIGQLAVGILFGLGQLATGLAVVAQLALALFFGIGQFATGYTAIGQFAFGKYVLAQFGIGEYVWSTNRADPEAIRYFTSLPVIRNLPP